MDLICIGVYSRIIVKSFFKILPLEDITSSSLFNTANEITTKFVSFVICAPSLDILTFSLKSGLSMLMSLFVIYQMKVSFLRIHVSTNSFCM